MSHHHMCTTCPQFKLWGTVPESTQHADRRQLSSFGHIHLPCPIYAPSLETQPKKLRQRAVIKHSPVTKIQSLSPEEVKYTDSFWKQGIIEMGNPLLIESSFSMKRQFLQDPESF